MHRVKNLDAITARDPYIGEALKDLAQAVNNMGQRVGTDPNGIFPTPQEISSISVVAANGVFDIQIVDDHLRSVGLPVPITYFAEYSTDKNFINPPPIVVNMGPSRNKVIFLGSQTLFWRGYSQYFGSKPSPPVVFGGSKPIGVVGGGAIAPPAPQKSQGSGSGTPSNPGAGFGKQLK